MLCMKKRVGMVLCVLLLLLSMTGCSSIMKLIPEESSVDNVEEEIAETEEVAEEEAAEEEGYPLVVFFSGKGHTQLIAEYVGDYIGAAVYEIMPEDPYSNSDMNYNGKWSRAYKEQHDAEARPAIQGGLGSLEDYSTIYLGYPIWFNDAPKIIYTFLESYDFTGKTIVPFCTSSESDIAGSVAKLRTVLLNSKTEDVTWVEGKRFESEATREDVTAWLEEIGKQEE